MGEWQHTYPDMTAAEVEKIAPGLTGTVETFRIEIRYDFTGTKEEAQVDALRVADTLEGGMVAEILDENWDAI